MNHTTRFTLAIATSSLLLAFNAHATPPKAPAPVVNEIASPQVSSVVSSPADNFKDVGNINALLCKDIMGMVDEDKTIALSLMHGYVMGKKGVTQYVSGSLGKASNEFIEYCLDHPYDKALDTFAKIAK